MEAKWKKKKEWGLRNHLINLKRGCELFSSFNFVMDF